MSALAMSSIRPDSESTLTTDLFPSDVEALIGRLAGIRTRSLAAQSRPNDRTQGIELGGR